MRIAEASKEVKEESNNKSAAFKLYLCRWSGASIIHHQAADVTLCFLRNRRHWLGFHSEGMGDRQTVRQTPLMTVLWSHCRSSPPPPRRKQIYSRHRHSRSIVRTHRGLVRSPAALPSQATVTRSSPALLLSRICSPGPPSLSFPSPFPFCLSLKMHPRVLMLPIKDSHNSDTVTNKPRSELPFPAPVDPPAESHQSQASWGEYWFQLSIH